LFYDDIVHKFREMTFKVIQGHRFWYQSKAHVWLLISH